MAQQTRALRIKLFQAQKLFRNISNVPVVPLSVYEQNQRKIDEALVNVAHYRNNKNDNPDPLKRRISRLRSLLLFIKNKSVAIPFYYLKKIIWRYLNRDYGIIVADINYNSELGAEIRLTTIKEIFELNSNSRMLISP